VGEKCQSEQKQVIVEDWTEGVVKIAATCHELRLIGTPPEEHDKDYWTNFAKHYTTTKVKTSLRIK